MVAFGGQTSVAFRRFVKTRSETTLVLEVGFVLHALTSVLGLHVARIDSKSDF